LYRSLLGDERVAEDYREEGIILSCLQSAAARATRTGARAGSDRGLARLHLKHVPIR
jgi:hypothetical protein